MEKILIYFDLILKKSTEENWLSQENITHVTEWALNNPFFEMTHYDFDKKLKLTSKDKVIKAISKNGGLMTFWSVSKDPNESIDVFFSNKNGGFSSEELRIIMSIPFDKVQSIVQLETFMWGTITLFNEKSFFGPSNSAIYKGELDFPRIRPLKFYAWLSEFALINIVDERYFINRAYNENLMSKANINSIIEAFKVSKDLNKTIADQIIGVNWIKSLDKKDLETGFSMREDFIQSKIQLAPTNEFNVLGDKMLFNISLLEKMADEAYFDYYYAGDSMGFKLIVLDKNLDVSKEDVKEIKKYKELKQISNVKPLKKVILLLPDRKYIEKLNLILDELQVDKCLYLDNEVNVWDITPRGSWKN